ncbi:MAG: hypothetical protein HC918_04120 [Oscillatoriales cyanobacterium SM2_1_8]|nr:hypothetical protein [Oscillatoriales cyanobacterium SM2_1_8]
MENAIALGLKPRASVIELESAQFLGDRLNGVVNVGKIGSPNLEKILLANPDLILGHDFNRELYPILQRSRLPCCCPLSTAANGRKPFWKLQNPG